MKSFCKDLRKHATEITVKKENATTTKKGKTILQTRFFDNAKKNLVVIMTKDIVNFDTIVITQANMHSIFNLRWDAKDRKKLLQSYIMGQIMTTILS